MKREVLVVLTFAATLGAAACSGGSDPAVPGGDEVTALLSVQPASGSANVSVGTTVVVAFDHGVAAGMEAYAALHEGTLAGPVVAGTWTRSADGTKLTFTPAAPLKPSTPYVIHLGGNMMDEDGHRVDLEMHGSSMGGQWATQSMMTGGMGMDGGSMGSHVGAGWQHPGNGSYGMIFTFTTAG